MVERVGETQSGRVVYRRVVVRNVICTAGIVISYAIASVIVTLTTFRESPTNDKVRSEQSCHKRHPSPT